MKDLEMKLHVAGTFFVVAKKAAQHFVACVSTKPHHCTTKLTVCDVTAGRG